MTQSEITSKFQVTIPQDVQTALGLKSGDKIIFEILENNTVMLKKVEPIDVTFLKALEPTLTEWDSKNDDEDYKSL